MNICGIELKANNVILLVLEDGKYIDIKIKKLIIEDDEKQEDIRKFCNEFLDFLQKNENSTSINNVFNFSILSFSYFPIAARNRKLCRMEK